MNRILLLLIINVLTVHIYAQDTETKGLQGNSRNLIREGNRHYNVEKIDDAERSYRRALEADETSNIATFNLGNALYRQQNYEAAAKKFEEVALGKSDKMDKARAYHNMGNSYLKQAMSNSPDTKQKLNESIEAYKQALRNNPNDFDSKYNLSYALNMLKQQEQNQDNQDNQDNNQDNQDNNQDNQDQQQQQDQNKDNQQQQQQQEISREDAQRMLDAIAQEEKELLEKLQQKEQTGTRNIEKKW